MSKTDQRSPILLPTALTEASIGCGVTVDVNGNAVLPAAGGGIIGVLYGLSGTGTGAVIRTACDGALLLQYGGTVTAATPMPSLKVNSSGQFITASAGDIAAGAAVAFALDGGSSGELHAGILFGAAAGQTSTGGVDDIVLGTTAPSNLTGTTFVQVTGTKTGVLGAGQYTGQLKRFIQSVASTLPVGTITGTFKDNVGAAKTTLNLGTAVATIGDFVWDGAAWRQTSAITGTGSSLA
jgi:hypothetical protein